MKKLKVNMSKSNLMFSEVNIFLSPLLKILKYFNFEVLYLDIKAQSKLKRDELAINLKKFGNSEKIWKF